MNLLKFMMSGLLKSYKVFKYGRISSFTYYIPAPPTRKSGYREREFDSLVYQLTQIGFEIKNITTQNHSDNGVWVFVTVQALTERAQLLKPTEFPFQQKEQQDNTLSLPKSEEHNDKVEGLYYID